VKTGWEKIIHAGKRTLKFIKEIKKTNQTTTHKGIRKKKTREKEWDSA